MLQHQADWRHWTAALLTAGLILAAGWTMLARPASRPDAPAPAGPHARLQDAPETPPASSFR